MLSAKIIGRHTIEDGKVKHIWTGSGIEFETRSSELAIKVYAEYEKFEIWIAVELNGARILRTMLLPGMNTIPVYKGLSSNDKHHVRIIKDSQATLDESSNYMTICEVIDLSGNAVETETPANKPVAIEFIGDSITSGEGLAGSTSDTDFAYCYTSFNGNYAGLVSQALDADYSIISQCGYGVVCGWNNDPSMNMPDVYRYADGKSVEYDFKRKFDYVVINLGTNDDGASHQLAWKGNKISSEAFREGVVNFLRYVLDMNPDAQVIWVIGMCPVSITRDLEEAISSVNSPRVTLREARSCDELDHGSRNHPGPMTHKAAAEMLVDVIKSLNSK